MDSRRFDSLVRSVLPCGTRRGVLATLLGGVLGGFSLLETRAKKKRKKKKQCGCPGGRKLLSNGSCAKVCDDDESDCAFVCVCSLRGVEGDQYCMPKVNNCAEIPLTCSTTVDCPLGQYCFEDAGDCGSNRCVPLCG